MGWEPSVCRSGSCHRSERSQLSTTCLFTGQFSHFSANLFLKLSVGRSVVSNSLWPYGLWPTRLLCGIIQTGILEWVAFPFSKESSQPGIQSLVSCIAGGFLIVWATREAPMTCWEAQFSSIQSLSCVWLFATPWTAACQASLSIANSQSLFKHMSIELVMPSNHLILCCPLVLLPSIFPSVRVFSNDSVLCIRWPKYWSFSFSISLSNEHSGLRGTVSFTNSSSFGPLCQSHGRKDF